jgi:hypothetical protein
VDGMTLLPPTSASLELGGELRQAGTARRRGEVRVRDSSAGTVQGEDENLDVRQYGDQDSFRTSEQTL